MYEFFQTLLWPLRWLVEATLWLWHELLTLLGMDPSSGLTWILSVLGLVVVVRSLLIPVTLKQIKSQRRMMEIQPEMKRIQEKYRGKRDQYSREAMSRETWDLYKKHGTTPFASCLPLLIQMPIFFSLYFTLRNAAENITGVGMMNEQLTKNFNEATLFGAPLRMNFSEAWSTGNTMVITMLGVIMVLMVASQFYTQRQIVSKNISDEVKQSPMYRQQQILLYIIPFAFLFSGFVFPLALNIYWFSSNVWTMVQQTIVINSMPTPGSEAYRMRQERLKARGKMTDDERAALARGEDPAEPLKPQGQRQQPMSAKRAKKQGGGKK